MASTIPALPPVTTSTATAGATTPKFAVPSPVSPTSVVGGSSSIRQGMAVTKTNATKLLSNINNLQQSAKDTAKSSTVSLPPTPTPTTPPPGATPPPAAATATAPSPTINYPKNANTGYPIYGTGGVTGVPGVVADANGNYQVKDGNGNPVIIDSNGNVVSSSGLPPGQTGSIPNPNNDPTINAANDAVTALSQSTDPASQDASAKVSAAAQALTDANNGNYSDADKQRITDAANAVIAQFQPLIDQAQQEKTQGVPKAIVQAGEMGGLLNTQFAGRSAVTASDAGFVGAGGQLEEIQSAYDRNIAIITAQRDSAVAQAKSAAQQAIASGKSSNLAAAQQLYNNAVSAHQQSLDQINAKFQTLFQAAQVPNTLAAGAASSAQSTLSYTTNLASGLLTVDPGSGMPTMPTSDQVAAFAKQNNVSLEVAQSAVNTAYSNQLKTSSAIQKAQLGSGTIAEYNTWAKQQAATGQTPTLDNFFASKAAASKQGTLLPTDAVKYYASQVEGGNTDVLSKLGSIGGAGAKIQIMSQVASDHASGVFTGDLSSNSALYNSLKGALNTVQKQFTQVKAAENKVTSQLGIVQGLAGKIDNSGVPVLNRWLNAGKIGVAGDKDVSNFANAVNTLSNELAKVLNGSVGIGGAPVEALKSAQSVLNTSMSPDQIQGAIDLLNQELATVDPSFQGAIDDATQGIQNLQPGSSTNFNPDTISPQLPAPTDNSAWGW